MKLCSIASGSSGNCLYVGTNQAGVMIDAGISKKRIVDGCSEFGIAPNRLDGIFITHEHADHIQGLGVLLRQYPMPVYGTKETLLAIRHMSSLGKLDKELFHEIEPYEDVRIKDMVIKPFSVSHDALNPVGYRFEQAEGTDNVSGDTCAVAIATDMGCYDDRIVSYLSGLKALLLEANHDVHMLQVGRYPYPLKQRILGDHGHLSNETSGRLINEIAHDGLRDIILGHLSKENNYERLAYETVRMEIEMAETPFHAEDFRIQVASREKPSCYVEV